MQLSHSLSHMFTTSRDFSLPCAMLKDLNDPIAVNAQDCWLTYVMCEDIARCIAFSLIAQTRYKPYNEVFL